MEINRLNVPEVDKLKAQLAQCGTDDFTAYWKKLFENRFANVGTTKSHDFIILCLNRQQNYRKTGQLELDFDPKDM